MTEPDDRPTTPQQGPRADGEGADATGLRAAFAKHRVAWITAASVAAFALLGSGALAAGASVGSGTPEAAPTPTATVTVEPPRAVPTAAPAPATLRTCSVAELAADSRLANFQGQVRNTETGEVLFDRKGDDPERTGSVLKVLTAASALAALGPDYRIPTRVVQGDRPGQIVLVGGGDPTISAVSNSFYEGAPKLSDLAAQALAAYQAANPGQPITELVLDATLWNPDDNYDESWDADQRTIGYSSLVTALQVDGDRQNPSVGTSPRSTDPVGRAGQAFADALGVPNATITRAAAPENAAVLGEVFSQPVSTLIGQMELTSDNTLAEQLARLVSLDAGGDGSFASLTQTIPRVLADTYGIPTDGMVIRDGSGLSEFNRVPPSYVAQLMVKVLNGENGLGVVYDALPVSGQTGTLASRFTGPNAVARGAINAKTGWIDTAYTLAGIVHAEDGSTLSFAFYAVGDGVQDSARQALDNLATGVWRCGANLAAN
ncbi:D-alanyl-D-alanine carboxypeptidase/D-alanyl-D-alanine endopeptidase [Herbiconiux sp. SYSU D00978]|uniref:D-alanyl-D-alanine carboxypeptidase/D-alanyl-D-alanine endopeptidase n=1 Tax=Herbiconiux sp. SYSU D00978 TaxID=2812562 RepID=UPI0027DBCF00|nr:D-alanyl-D-alanine carboxypeptidase/D-alanyl-D-alanine-endopeptidase [Herbiconiux sp. SYSU D00978]